MNVIEQLDQVVDEHARKTRFFREPLTVERARMLVRQHRLNTRQRNSVHKLATAINCPDWETRVRILAASAEEVIADHNFGGGRPHYAILEELGVTIGMDIEDIRRATPIATTQIAWLAWETLTRNRHWLEGLVANTCSERVNCPGYGEGRQRKIGFSGMLHEQYKAVFGLTDAEEPFWGIHSEADVAHSNLGWQTLAERADALKMSDAVVEAARVNLQVWEMYWNGIGDAADEIAATAGKSAVVTVS